MNGKHDGTFGVVDNVICAHMVKVPASASDIEGYSRSIFDDVTKSKWTREDIVTYYLSRITAGKYNATAN